MRIRTLKTEKQLGDRLVRETGNGELTHAMRNIVIADICLNFEVSCTCRGFKEIAQITSPSVHREKARQEDSSGVRNSYFLSQRLKMLNHL